MSKTIDPKRKAKLLNAIQRTLERNKATNMETAQLLGLSKFWILKHAHYEYWPTYTEQQIMNDEATKPTPQLTAGQTVTVYEDPITCTKVECIARLIKKTSTLDVDDLEFWIVETDTNEQLYRKINKRNH